jgi:hypothetical protein
VTVQRGRVELCQHIDLGYVAVQTVADRDINKPVVGTQRHGRLGTLLGEGIQSSPCTTSKNDSKHTRAGVRVEAGLRALGVGHRARGEDERPPPPPRRRGGGGGGGHPSRPPRPAFRDEEAERVARCGCGGVGGVVGGGHAHGCRHRHCGEARARARVTGSLRGWPRAGWRRREEIKEVRPVVSGQIV